MSEPASIRLRILRDFCSVLGNVATVYRNPSAPVPPTLERWLVVTDEGHEEAGEYAEREGIKSLRLTVEGYARGAADDAGAEEMADTLYWEAVRFGCLDPSRGGLAMGTRETSCVLSAAEGEDRELIGLCTVGFEILFSADPADPRSAP